jgi:hypothetical protein
VKGLLLEVEAAELERLAGSTARTVFISCTGSHMWGMNTPERDIDLVIIYIAPTRSLLRGERILPAVRQRLTAHRGEIYDTLGWEIGHLINQLIRGNVNAIWYATSPLVIRPSAVQEELSTLVRANLSRATYRSIRGMAESQIRSEGKPATDPKIAGKGYRTALRTIEFGIRLLSEGRICYSPAAGETGAERVWQGMRRLEEAYESSPLPDRPEEDVFRDFLMRLRLEEMEGKMEAETKGELYGGMKTEMGGD